MVFGPVLAGESLRTLFLVQLIFTVFEATAACLGNWQIVFHQSGKVRDKLLLVLVQVLGQPFHIFGHRCRPPIALGTNFLDA